MLQPEAEYRQIDSKKTVVAAEDVHKAIKQIKVDEERPMKEVVDKLLREHPDIRNELPDVDKDGGPLQNLDDGTELRHQYHTGEYQGTIVKAVVIDGRILYGNKTYESPSPAAIHADEDIRGEDGISNINGWRWWQFERDDEWIEIDQVR